MCVAGWVIVFFSCQSFTDQCKTVTGRNNGVNSEVKWILVGYGSSLVEHDILLTATSFDGFVRRVNFC